MNYLDLESKYRVEDITIKKNQIWPVLRFKIFETIRSRSELKSRIVKMNGSTMRILIKTSLYGFLKLLGIKKYSYWIFSSSDNRKLFNGLYHDRIVEEIFAICPEALEFESPFPSGSHYSKNQIPNRNVVSRSILFLGSYIFTLFLRKDEIANENILKMILSDYQIDFDYRKVIKIYYGQYRFMKFLLRFSKPKMVFWVYTASSMGFIRAIKENNIPVIELQHGVINEKHQAYYLPKEFNREHFPDYLFTYGVNELKYFNQKNFFLPNEKIIPVGYSFIEKATSNPSSFKEYEQDLRTRFDAIIVYSFQEPFDDFIISFISKAASISSSIGFLIIPRDPNRIFSSDLPTNIIIERRANIYEALKICDFHVTINSTCALEAFRFGKPTILIDKNNWASLYYGDTFKNLKGVKYINTVEELVHCIQDNDFPTPEGIIEEGTLFFNTNFQINFKRAIEKIINSK